MKFKSMTDRELEKISDKLTQEIESRIAKEDAFQKIKAEVEKSGFFLDDLIKTGMSKRVKVAPKWRHKEDKSLTWSGRGRQPKWIKKFGVKI